MREYFEGGLVILLMVLALSAVVGVAAKNIAECGSPKCTRIVIYQQ